MALLTLFAFLAGAGTAVSPCVLPVLPALLSATVAGGKRRPIGVVTGLTVTFSLTIVGIAKVVKGVGLGDGATRNIAIVVVFAAGVALLVPWIGDRLEAPLSRLSRFGPAQRGDGLWSGLLVGAALGFVYAPCAGPILAAVVSVSAATGQTVVIGIAYALGTAVVLLLVALLGRRLLDRVRGPGLQRALGAIMVLTAVALVTRLDVSLETAIAQHAPNFNLTAGLEKSHAVRSRLDGLRAHKSRFAAAAQAPAPGPRSKLKDYGPAPEFVGNQQWFNTPGNKPLALQGLRGHVVLIDFWTYTCINCLRTLPYLEAWDKRYRNAGLTIVGVHSPEFSFEHDAGNVHDAIGRLGIHYPVAQDNNLSTWNAWGNQYWPAEYLIDASGHVRHVNFGEGGYGDTERAIRQLLAEAGHAPPGGMAKPRGVVTPTGATTPETYVGAQRAMGFAVAPKIGVHSYRQPGTLPLNAFALGGTWEVSPEHALALPGARLDAQVHAKNVYLVASGHGTVAVLVDGRPERTVRVNAQRLYTLVSNPSDRSLRLTLRPSAGIALFSFTFG